MASIRPSNIWQQEILHGATVDASKIDERLKAGQQLTFWSTNGHIPFVTDQDLPDHLAKLLGYSCYAQLMHEYNERDSEILRALVGSHGFAIYKALEARNHELES